LFTIEESAFLEPDMLFRKLRVASEQSWTLTQRDELLKVAHKSAEYPISDQLELFQTDGFFALAIGPEKYKRFNSRWELDNGVLNMVPNFPLYK